MIKSFAKKYPFASAIISVVAACHFAFILSMLFVKTQPHLYEKKTLTVNTKYLPKQQIRVTPHRKKSPTKKKVVKQVPKRKKLLQNLEESIAKIDGKRDNSTAKTDLVLPISVDFSREVVEEEQLEVAYQERLVDELKSSLKLPGCGNVTVKLTLAKNGNVLGVQIVHGASDINKEYLSSMLTVMNFPPFEGSLRQYNEQTFLLTFCSD
jgi:hypothetical protein